MPNAQFIQLGPFYSSGSLVTSPKLYHYSAGTTTDKNIWSDRSESTTLAQPFVGDANGVFNFFADGLYKFVIKDSNDNTLDNVLIKDFSAPTLAEGSAIPSAQTTVLGDEVFAHITGTTNIEGLSGSIPFFWAVFDGSLSLVHSATLICPGGVNLSVQSGDVLFFLREDSVGTTWRVAGQMPNSLLVNRTDVTVVVSDSRTNSVDAPFTITSTTSGTPATGIGTGILLRAESADESPSDFGQMEFAASDVTSGSEDTYFQVLLRVAGAALAACYRFAATTTNKAIFTHANSADRTYTLPDTTGAIVVVGAGNCNTTALKTSTGVASASSTTVTFAMNDYSFFPMTWCNGSQAGALRTHYSTDQSTTVGALGIYDVAADGTSVGARWRYVTASDNPEMWVIIHPVTGAIIGAWASDDPAPVGSQAINVPGYPSAVRLRAQDLEHLSVLSAKAFEAQAVIRDRKLRMEHQAYRALQLLVNDSKPEADPFRDIAPAVWLLENCEMKNGKIEVKKK
jgi:hypothetical protein